MEKKKKLKYRKAHNIKWFKYYFSKLKNVFKYIYNVFKYIFTPRTGFGALGTHIITGYPGAGKTLLMNKIINSVDSEKYFFYTNIDEFKQDNVYHIELEKIFDDKKQIARLNTCKGKRVLYGLILDEINLNFNKRINQTKEYNNMFIGLIEFIVTHRHQHIPRIYFIGQKLELQDTQLISLFKYQHDIIRSKKRFRYWKYYESYVEKIPVKLKVVNKIKGVNDEFTEISKTKVKITWFDLSSYNTFALGKIYNNLPVYNGKMGG
jgi:hypothetical protein